MVDEIENLDRDEYDDLRLRKLLQRAKELDCIGLAPEANEYTEATVLLIHAHLLPSFETLLNCLVDDFGFSADNIIVVGKAYSSIPVVASRIENRFGVENTIIPEINFRPGLYDNSQTNNLYHGCARARNRITKIHGAGSKPRILLVDDGGLMTTVWESNFGHLSIDVVSIQITASGINRAPYNIPKIDMARSAAKRNFESKVIADAIVKKIDTLDTGLFSRRIGIAGMGAIGTAVARKILSKVQFNCVAALDSNPVSINRSLVPSGHSSVSHFLARTDVIFGCTGANWTTAISRKSEIAGKVFVSCSSRDVEFKYLLENCTADYDLDSIKDLVAVQRP